MERKGEVVPCGMLQTANKTIDNLQPGGTEKDTRTQSKTEVLTTSFHFLREIFLLVSSPIFYILHSLSTITWVKKNEKQGGKFTDVGRRLSEDF